MGEKDQIETKYKMKDAEDPTKSVWKNSLKDYPENLAIIKNRPFYIFEVG